MHRRCKQHGHDWRLRGFPEEGRGKKHGQAHEGESAPGLSVRERCARCRAERRVSCGTMLGAPFMAGGRR